MSQLGPIFIVYESAPSLGGVLAFWAGDATSNDPILFNKYTIVAADGSLRVTFSMPKSGLSSVAEIAAYRGLLYMWRAKTDADFSATVSRVQRALLPHKILVSAGSCILRPKE